MEISICTGVFGPEFRKASDFERAAGMAAVAGYRLVEPSGSHLRLPNSRSALAAAGLEVWAVHGSFGSGAISESADERRHTLDRELELLHMAAAYAPCPYVIHYLSRHNDPAVAERWRNSVQELLVHAAALQLTLAVETVPFKPEVNERYADTAEVAAFVRAFDSEYLRVCVDVNHANLHEDLGQAICNCSGQISDIHISDNHGLREEHLQPGEGVIDMPFALAALREAGYSGPCNLECYVPGGLTVESLSALRVAAEELVAKSMSVL